MRDVRSALRFLLKEPGWAVAAVLTVAIGIAGSTLAFSLVDRALWRPLGFPDGGELVTLYARSAGEYSTIAWPNYVAFRDVLHDDGEGPADLAAFVRTFSTIGGGEFPELHEGELVSGNFFSVLRVQPFLGRIITPSDNLAAFLALIGFYGLMGYVVGRREREIGIRAALGATPASIVRLVLRQAERLAGTGLLVGLVLSVSATGGLAGLLYETAPRDPLTLAGAAVVLGLAAMFAAFGPARRAARVDPATVLRAE